MELTDVTDDHNRLVEAFMAVLDTHRWQSMGLDTARCECGVVVKGDRSLTGFPADQAFRRHVADQLALEVTLPFR